MNKRDNNVLLKELLDTIHGWIIRGECKTEEAFYMLNYVCAVQAINCAASLKDIHECSELAYLKVVEAAKSKARS